MPLEIALQSSLKFKFMVIIRTDLVLRTHKKSYLLLAWRSNVEMVVSQTFLASDPFFRGVIHDIQGLISQLTLLYAVPQP